MSTLELDQVTHDITRYKNTEDALRFSEARYRALYNDNPTMIVTLTADLTMVSVNPYCAGQLGYTIDELEGQPAVKLFHEDDRPAVAEQLRKCLQNPYQVSRWQFRKIRKDGGVLWVEETAQAVYDLDGAITILIVCQDVTDRKRIEDELKKTNMQNELILASAGEGIVGLDKEGNQTFINASAAAMLGHDASELIGKPSHATWHYARPDGSHYPHEKCPIYSAYKDGTVHSGEEIFLRKDGTGFPVQFTSRPIIIDGEIAGAVLTFNDITERKQMEEAFRESEERFRATFNQAAVGIGHVTPDGHWLRINQKYCDVVGYTEKEIKTLTINEITHPDDLAASMHLYQQLLEGKLKNYSLEKRYIRKDGSTVWVNLTASMVFDTNGNPVFAIGVVEDISKRKQAEEVLHLSEERYRSLYNDTPVMLHSIDQDSRLVSVSNNWLETLGYERSEVLGRKFTDFLTAESCAHATAAVIPEFFRSGSIKEVPYQIMKKNGEILDVQLSAIAEQDRKGKVIRSLAVMVDVTERKRAEEEIERLNVSLTARAADLEYVNRELEAFNYTVAHDLRNPLNVISSCCQVFKEMCGDKLDEQCMRYIHETYDGALRMNRLIEALLNFSRLAHAELNRDRVDLSSMAKEVAEGLKRMEASRQVEIRISDGIVANGDANLLQVVLTNLLDNAWKYTAARKEALIEFGAKEIDGKLVYFVQDNGDGFDNADAEKIFAPLQRLPGAEACRGFGIGLATVERIVRRHGGRVYAEGEPGKGAIFYFTLSADGK